MEAGEVKIKIREVLAQILEMLRRCPAQHKI